MDSNRKLDETRIFAAIQEANELDSLGKTELAVQVLMPILGEFPEEPGVRIYLSLYLRCLGRYNEAIQHGQHSVRLAPHASFASAVLFQALWDGGYRSDAIGEIRRFLPIRRSKKRTVYYEEVLRRWEAGDQDAADHVKVAFDTSADDPA